MTNEWMGPDENIGAKVSAESAACLGAYGEKANLVEQDAGIEISNVEGGYGRKQIHELIQNGADAMRGTSGRVRVTLTPSHLYCANEGRPVDERGIEALMASHLSTKRDDQIGRFGLGFKSVLGISDAPEILSRSGSLRFNRHESRRRILAVVPGATKTPVLRLAEPLDAHLEARTDAVLEEMMAWATTVVRLPLKVDTGWLSEELGSFPPEFLLFAEHVSALEIHDHVMNTSSDWQARRDGTEVVLSGAGSTAVWNVFRAKHRPTPAALADAGEIAGRDEVELVWAAPRTRRATPGRFWAFFPTSSQGTLSGIVNAPFKTTEDRHDILDGAYNRELLETVLPWLVASALPDLVDADDPGSLFDLLPARGRESRSWADERLNDPVIRAVAATECIPNSDGRLCAIADIRLSPTVLADHPRWNDMWSAVPETPAGWIHPSITQRTERRAKAVRLYALARAEEASMQVWLEALARAGVQGSRTAVQLADLVNKSEPDHMVHVRRARIVLRADGTLVPPVVGKVFVPSPDDESTDDATFVSRELVDDVDTLEALTSLGIGQLDAVGRLNAQIASMAGGTVRGQQVESLWNLIRVVGRSEARPLLEKGFGAGLTPVRTVSTKIRPVGRCLVPGAIVPADGSRDADVAIDFGFHALDHDVLADLGAVAGPRLAAPKNEPWFDEWRDHAKSVYLSAARASGFRTVPASVSVRSGKTAAHLDVLRSLSPQGRAAFTREVLQLPADEWVVYAEARGAAPPVRIVNPGVWWIRKHGAVSTPFGVCAVEEAIAPLADVRSHLLPVPYDLDGAQLAALAIRTTADLADWQRFIRLGERHLDSTDLTALYATAAREGCPPPDEVRVPRTGFTETASTSEVVVTADVAVFGLLEGTRDALLAADQNDLEALVGTWSMQDAGTLLTRTVLHAASGDPVAVLDRFPGLRVTAPGKAYNVEIQPCSELAVQMSTASDETASSLSDQQVVLDPPLLYVLDNLTDDVVLSELSTHLRLGLDAVSVRQTVEIGERRQAGAVVQNVRKAKTSEDKLLALAGEDEIRKLVPADAIRVAEQRKGRSLKPAEIAKMAQRSAGGQIIRKLAPAIEARGIDVPTQLTGGSRATSFTKDLGLPIAYAGSKDNVRAEIETVPGPVRLPELHDYQTSSIERIRSTLAPGGLRRGLLALPTGSGKTRVAVEALIDHIREVERDTLVVWIAQTDELCEQAVETWTYMWRAVGPHETDLVVNRLWGSNNASPAESGAQVVVATDDKLLSLSKRNGHEWLAEASVVVVDEAHTSISPTYTELFNWLGRGTRERDKPLIGLSATPFRGTNEEQTKLLVNRYDKNLLTDGLFGDRDPHVALQDMGILARVRHQVLPGIKLRAMTTRTDGDRFHLLESRVDLNQVATDDQRNARILDSIIALDEDVTVIVFAASVPHAEQLAAVLDSEGVPAAAVSAFTPAAERRERVRQFQSGELRVVTNYNVLSQGFDAPRVGAVYVARPTFSPNRYQQMIGRGLRGPRNGGSEEVLIVNVQDNIDAFGEQLAFHHFDVLWKRET